MFYPNSAHCNKLVRFICLLKLLGTKKNFYQREHLEFVNLGNLPSNSKRSRFREALKVGTVRFLYFSSAKNLVDVHGWLTVMRMYYYFNHISHINLVCQEVSFISWKQLKVKINVDGHFDRSTHLAAII